jgi:hypothetical protein
MSFQQQLQLQANIVLLNRNATEAKDMQCNKIMTAGIMVEILESRLDPW